MDELRAVSTFVRAAELGSFHKAAQDQGMTPQAVSKSVRQLEQHLGVRLFHRTRRKSSLTEEGQRLFDSVRENLDGLVAALSRARSAVRDEEGVIRISAGGAVGRKVLVPLLAAFNRQCPAIEFDLLLEDGFTDAVSDRIDVGFRSGAPPTHQVVARRLFAIQQIVCAAPADLVEPGIVATELQDHVTFQGARDWLANAAQTIEFLQPEDVVQVVGFIVAQPRHVNLQQVVIMPTKEGV